MQQKAMWYVILMVACALTVGTIGCGGGGGDDGGGNGGGNGGNGDTGLFADVPAPNGATFLSEGTCREGGAKRTYSDSGDALDIATAYQSVLDGLGWNTFNLGGISLGAGFQATKDGRYLNFQNGGPPSGERTIYICVWPSQPQDDNCDENCND